MPLVSLYIDAYMSLHILYPHNLILLSFNLSMLKSEMENHFSSKSEIFVKEEDNFSFLTQIPPDYSNCWWGQNEHLHCFYDDPLPTPFDVKQMPSTLQDNMQLGFTANSFWGELGALFEPTKQNILPQGDTEVEESGMEMKGNDRNDKKRGREEKCSSSSKQLTRKIISQYFYMPITQAAKELNVGLTLLKKSCRDVGIRRWPHRKLLSLQTLIKNVQELEKEEGDEGRLKLRAAVEVLERERKMLEEMPDIQLDDKTKRLRQACFKANYKKRKLMSMTDGEQSSLPGVSQTSLDIVRELEDVFDYEEDD